MTWNSTHEMIKGISEFLDRTPNCVHYSGHGRLMDKVRFGQRDDGIEAPLGPKSI